MKEEPEKFLKKTFMSSLFVSVTFLVLLFMVFDKMKIPLLSLLVIIPVIFALVFFVLIQAPRVIIRKREREINKEVLFAGRYLLVKLDSGIPLFNSLIDASNSYGIAAKYFKEIVDDINMGNPIEYALENARENSPSHYFKLVLSELITSLKTGVDVSIPLRSIIQQITIEQTLEIKEYGKKLNAFMMLYMVLATVMPSLGMTMFIVFAGFMGLDVGATFIGIALFCLTFIQFMFLTVLRSIRPMVNL